MNVYSTDTRFEGNLQGHFFCNVPECRNSAVETPEKLWIEVPHNVDMRRDWLRRGSTGAKKILIFKGPMYFCEDHFDLENDMENYEEYKTTGSVKKVKMKPNCVPTKFDCQEKTKETTAWEVIQPEFEICSAPKTQDEITQPVGSLQPSNVRDRLSFQLEDLTEDSQTCEQVDLTEAASDTLFCVCCLKKDDQYTRLMTCVHTEFLHNMPMPEIKPNDLMICHQCHQMLIKIQLFKQQVEESFKRLSDKTETIPKCSNQIHNFETRQNVNINIPEKGEKAKPVIVDTNVRIEPNKDVIKKEQTDPIDEIEENSKPRSPDKKVKQSKNIEEALRIINNNQNSDCINLLTNSLQDISSKLISGLLTNCGSLVDKKLPKTFDDGENGLPRKITPTLKEKITDAKKKLAFQSGTSKNVTKLTLTSEKLANFLEENASKVVSINNLAIPTGSLTNKIAKALMANTTKVTAHSERTNNDSIKLTINTVKLKENLDSKIEENSRKIDATKNCNNKKPLTPEDIRSIIIPVVDPNLAKKSAIVTEELAKKEDPVEIIARVITEHYSMVDNVLGEESNQPVTVKEECVGDDQPETMESVGDGENIVQATKVPKALDTRPSLGENIVELTLSRRKLMDERARTAASETYLRAPHKCVTCLIGFQFHENLEDHRKRKHTRTFQNLQAAVCDICHQLVDGDNMEMHKFWHYTRYQCVACGQLFATYDRAGDHYKKQHVLAVCGFKCPHCTFMTSAHRLLDRHTANCRPAPTDPTQHTRLTNSTGATEAKRPRLTPTV